MRPRKLFIAGSSGATGRQVMALAVASGLDVVAHLRPKPGRRPDTQHAVFELSDTEALVAALRTRTTILQLIGTVRRRFASGDTYETSDIGTTRALVDAGREAGVDHLVLLSSAGAGYPIGAYLRAKAATEQLVQASSVPWTIFRPSAFQSDEQQPPRGFALLTRALGLRRFQPMPLSWLARGLLRSAQERAPLGTILEGAELFGWVNPTSR
ncbi:MAG: SDR family oxidoreductase [Myxococcaceae bacterium]